jgi:ligand-binding SRPBCC domain-containing protein
MKTYSTRCCFLLMKISITTQVEQDYKTVLEGFTRDLFLALAPPFPPVNLLRFDGCQKGDIVELELNMIFFKQRWDALIIESGEKENEVFFTDIGTKLPFFLKTWKHFHRILQNPDQTSSIIDHFEYTTPFLLLDYLMYPVLYAQFAWRKPIYKKLFRRE